MGKLFLIFHLEPVICEGGTSIKHWNDGWTVVTSDNKRFVILTEYF